MATASIDASELTVHVHGLDQLWALRSQLTIPLSHVRGATDVREGDAHEPEGLRGPGAHAPGVIVAGTFHQDGQRVFWDVHDRAKVIVIELDDDTYQRLVIEVPDPRAAVDYIERAIAQP